MKKNCIATLALLFLYLAAAAQQDDVRAETRVAYVTEKTLLIPAKGEVKAVYNNGNPHYAGTAKNKKLHGSWQSWYANNQACDSGTLIKGIPDGTWQVWYPDGALQFVRNYSVDKWQRFQNEKDRHDPRQIVYPISTLYRESRNKAHQYLSALYAFCFAKNCEAKLRKQAAGETESDNTFIDHYHPVFEEGMLHGEYINYFPNGVVKDSGAYENGLPHDIWIHRLSDKTWWRGAYHHGEKDKEWKLYDTDGKLVEVVDYKNGKEVWRKRMERKIKENRG